MTKVGSGAYSITSAPGSGRPRNHEAMRKRTYYAYILTNAHHTVLYVGVTNDMRRRLAEHRSGRGSAFTRRYNVGKLVWLEAFDDVRDAIACEKRLKAGSRRKKLDLIAEQNPTWRDYGEDLHRL